MTQLSQLPALALPLTPKWTRQPEPVTEATPSRSGSRIHTCYCQGTAAGAVTGGLWVGDSLNVSTTGVLQRGLLVF